MPFKHLLNNSIKEHYAEYVQTDLSAFMIDLFLSENCNLRCKHCYFGKRKPALSPLSAQEWILLINDFISKGCRHIHISGKESLLGSDIETVITFLNKAKEVNQDIFWGIITNGTSVDCRQYNHLLATSIDYLEISIDGDKDTHDYIRGAGVYRRVLNTISNLEELSKINISYTINKYNAHSFKKIVKEIYDLGISKFYCSPMKLKGRAISSEIETIKPEHYINVIEDIKDLLTNEKFQKVNIKFSIPPRHVEYIIENEIYHQDIKDYFHKGKPIFWKIGTNIVEISLHTISIPLFTQASITSDGYILSSSDKVEELNNYGRYINISSFMKLRKSCITKYFQ